MTFRKIIENCDRLYPNLFSFDEKFGFCNELSGMLHINYFADTETVDISGNAKLPAGVTADRVRAVYIDGVNTSVKSFESILEKSDGHKITVEYINIPQYTPDNHCPVSSPFDELYTYYVIAKICLHNEYIEGYNNYMALFNSLLLEFKKKFSSADINGTIRFKNLW